MIHVAVAVIFDSIKNEILIAKRHKNKHQGGKWEFPGGKVEVDEPVTVALVREIKEELAIEIDISETHKLDDVRFSYDDIDVWLDVWWVSAFEGEPKGAEGQIIKWASIEELKTIDFPEANQQILTAITQELSTINAAKK
jgi:8-oxo-dGTP diphosphatase